MNIFKRLFKFKGGNPKIYNKLKFSEYEKLPKDQKEQVDYLLEYVNPVNYIFKKNTHIELKHSDIFLYSWGEIIEIKEAIKGGDLSELLRISIGEWQDFDCDVYQYFGVIKHIMNEIEVLSKAESTLKDDEDAGVWERSGVSELEPFGNYLGVMMFTDGILDEDKVLKIEYSRIFMRMQFAKTWERIQRNYSEIKSKQ